MYHHLIKAQVATQHNHDHAEIRQIIQQYGSRTEIITIMNEWLKYQKYLEKPEILTRPGNKGC